MGSGRDPNSSSPSPTRDRTADRAGRRLRILVAEDSPVDAMLIREALESHRVDADVTIHRDGGEMLAAIERIGKGEQPCPDLFMLDLNLPKVAGSALLARIRQDRVCEDVPVIIVTSSDAYDDRQTAAGLGATEYFRKSTDMEEFMRLGEVVRALIGRERPN